MEGGVVTLFVTSSYGTGVEYQPNETQGSPFDNIATGYGNITDQARTTEVFY